ncbi:citrate/2-methylcitrate synthase [Amycolatopsis mediterranei]|uniref:citrate/2-methylcitrate synthase n=1 Tax=Amycolatopsis mediterranei TaxID=33910 RepID=UPI001E55B06C|nr:citrate/2-methylcitrate synthase [Amycolatopsis mediterranei]UZF74068.1 hypothetical protein ISP_007553 [Amycolatopsis mediterranei]
MGFGHRVYKKGDSRLPTMRHALQEVAELRDGHEPLDLHEALARAMYAEKGLHLNLDYPAGPAYHLMGFDTPIFVAARITGWTAHIMEQLAANSLIRLSSTYSGFCRALPRGPRGLAKESPVTSSTPTSRAPTRPGTARHRGREFHPGDRRGLSGCRARPTSADRSVTGTRSARGAIAKARWTRVDPAHTVTIHGAPPTVVRDELGQRKQEVVLRGRRHHRRPRCFPERCLRPR